MIATNYYNVENNMKNGKENQRYYLINMQKIYRDKFLLIALLIKRFFSIICKGLNCKLNQKFLIIGVFTYFYIISYCFILL